MKIFNHFRASGNLGSMRAAKANKKEAVWSIFANGYPRKPKVKSPKPLKKTDNDKKKISNAAQKKPVKKKDSITMQIQSVLSRTPDNSNINNNNIKKLNETTSFRAPIIPPTTSPTNAPPEGPKPAQIDELHLGTIDHISRDPEELQQTVSMLESKLVSLSNINCALQSQIDEITGSYNKLKAERDEIRRGLDEAHQEIEMYRQKLEKKKKDKK